MEPIMAVWSGKSPYLHMSSITEKFRTLLGYSLGGTSLPENELAPYIQQAIDQVRMMAASPR